MVAGPLGEMNQDRLVALLKFGEVGSRAGFVVLTSYSLTLAEAGLFGLLVTLQGLASFAYGYERHTDIQRRVVGQSDVEFDLTVIRAAKLWGVNYLLVSPLYLGLLWVLGGGDLWLLGLALVIAVAEQLMNMAYQLSLVNKRYFVLMAIAVAKNAGILLTVLWAIFLSGNTLSLELVLTAWAGWSVAATLIAGVLWIKRLQADHIPPADLVAQYRASGVHFLLGLVAILTLQVDRLVIGAAMPLDQVGVYFRHVLLVSMIYQVFNILFYNRILPRVFTRVKTDPLGLARGIVSREYRRVLIFVAGVLLLGVLIHLGTAGAFADRFALVPAYFAALLLVTIVRMRADYNALLFNALHLEKTIFKLQLISFLTALPVLVGLTYWIGIPGTIFAGFCGALIYFTLTHHALRKFPDDWSFDHDK
ncbi:MAG: hypothetical protein AB8B60_15310 [Sulfitobacter sp.]